MADQDWARSPATTGLSMEQLRRRPSYRLLVAVGLPIIVVAGVFFLYLYDPTRGNPILPCLFNSLTGLDCIGCGTTRALHALLHGDFLTALSFNLVMPFWLLLPAYALLSEWLQALAGRRLLPGIRDSRWLLITLLISSVAFMVLRNLPWEPFTWLAA